MPTRPSIVVELVEALAEAERVSPWELPYSLSDDIDPEILSRLAAAEGGTWTFTGRVADHEVVLSSDGRLFIDGVLFRRDVLVDGRPSSGA